MLIHALNLMSDWFMAALFYRLTRCQTEVIYDNMIRRDFYVVYIKPSVVAAAHSNDNLRLQGGALRKPVASRSR